MMPEVRCILFPGKPKVLNDVRSPLYYFMENQNPMVAQEIYGKVILFLVKSDRITDVFRSKGVKFNYFGSGPV
jgi:hypothetical protein